MYSRGYYPEQKEKISIPEGYDGTMLFGKDNAPPDDEGKSIGELAASHSKMEIKMSPPLLHNLTEPEDLPVFKEESHRRSLSFLSIFDSLPLGRLKSLIKRDEGENIPFAFDFEDLLILGIALFLIFSKSGDRELGLLLAALIFIK